MSIAFEIQGERLDVDAMVSTRAGARALLAHLAQAMAMTTAAPAEGGATAGAPRRSVDDARIARILDVFVAMTHASSAWLDGDLRVELVGDGDVCVVEVLAELGGAVRERVIPAFAMKIALGAVVRAVDAAPGAIAPLVAAERTARRFVLAVGSASVASAAAAAAASEPQSAVVAVTAEARAPGGELIIDEDGIVDLTAGASGAWGASARAHGADGPPLDEIDLGWE